jgi:hypothetical protein
MKKTAKAKEKATATPKKMLDGKMWTDPMCGPFFTVKDL